MKRSGFKPKSYAEAVVERSSFRQRAPIGGCRRPMKRGGRLKPGRKVKEWSQVRAWLKVQFEKRGITCCEFSFILHECWRTEGLGFAHSHKRRDPNFEMYAVALACPAAHQILDEVFSHEQMFVAVYRAIENHSGVIKP